MGLLLLIVPICSVILFMIMKKYSLLHCISIFSAIILFIVSMLLTKNVIDFGVQSYELFNGFFYVDALSIIFIDIVTFLGLLVSIYSVYYLETDLRQGSIDKEKIRLYYILLYTFIFTMILALAVKNIGIMWVAIEATTLSSAFLVGFYNHKRSIEASWKYIIICSVGIAIAFLGIIFLHSSSLDVVSESQMLDWTTLYEKARLLESPMLRLAFLFILVGFGAKAGLAPMHTWLPGAHSQAPSPISALLSGVLLNSAMYGIIRVVAIVNRNLGSSEFTGKPLMAIGILSIILAAVLILSQKEYKSLLAYSSIEHMGIITFALGVFTPGAIFAALFHMINHSLTKSMLFLSAGNILQKYQSGKIYKIRGILRVLPISGTVFLLGLLAIAGVPPFSVFASELNVLAAIFSDGKVVIGSVFAILLAFIFSGIVYCLFRMFIGQPIEQVSEQNTNNVPGTAVILVLLILIIVTGFYMPIEVKELIVNAQMIILGE